ncbi:MAG: oxidoreductase [Cellulosilyticum sp.]|nr:oxidoreductase [Cellulosilyticum sp.]
MRKLCIKLPPFAPDYSGVCSALYELGGMSVIHDASGCTGNYTGFDEPRWYDNQKFVFCSGLRELDAVLGDDQKLIHKVMMAAEDLKPEFITVLGSPVPMIIGSDFTGIATEIENMTNIPSLGFGTTGLNYYDMGISQAYMQLAKRFVKACEVKEEKTVNILGATPLDFSVNENITDLIALLERNGYKVNASWSMHSTLEAIKETAKAEMNIVISVAGLELARYLEKHHQMPYVVGVPVGKSGETRLIEALKAGQRAANEVTNQVEVEEETSDTQKRVLIIGEQVLSNSLRAYLKDEHHMENVDVATFFKLDKEIAGQEDIDLNSELQLIKLLKLDTYDVIIGDPLFKQLIPSYSKAEFIGLPHVAVSSRLYWHNSPRVMGEHIDEVMKK